MEGKKSFLLRLKQYGIEHNIPNISEQNADFLCSLLSSMSAKNVLEIGTANGYSTLHFAYEIQTRGGKITTIEFSQKSYEQAQENFLQAGMSDVICQYFGDAREIIPHLDEAYDFIFIDGLKKASLDFYLLVKEKLSPGGVIVIDDVIKFEYKMKNLYEYLKQTHTDFEIVPIDEDDGIMILRS